MPPIFSKLKAIDNHTKNATLGFIRRIETSQLNGIEIPICIKQICMLYYYETEYFSFVHDYGHGLTLLSNNIVETTEKNTSPLILQTHVYGVVVIEPVQNPYSVYNWTLKLNKYHDFMFGIITSSCKLNGPIWKRDCNNYYAICTSDMDLFGTSSDTNAVNHIPYEYCMFNHIVKLEVDIGNKCIRYYEDNESTKPKIAFTNVTWNDTYRFFIEIRRGSEFICELLEFKKEIKIQ
eukprot:78885_1